MLFRFFDHIHIIVAAHVGFQPGFSLRNRSGNPRGLPQPELEFADPPDRVVVSGPQRPVLLRADADRQHHRMADIVENDHLVGDQERALRSGQTRLRLRQLLKFAHRFVAEVADRTAEKRRKLRRGGGTHIFEQFAQRHECTLRRRKLPPALPVLIERPALFHGEHAARIQPDKRIAAELLARLDALQQEHVFIIRQPRQHRNRRLQIRDHPLADRNQVGAGRHSFKFLKRNHFHFSSIKT